MVKIVGNKACSGDDEKVRRLRIMNITTLIVVFAAVFWAVIDWFVLGRWLQPIIEIAGAFIGVSFLWWQRRIEDIDLTTGIFIAIFGVAILLINFVNGISSSNSFWLFLTPLFAFFISGRGSGIFWTVVAFVYIFIVSLLANRGIIGGYVDFEFILDMLSVFALISFFAALYEGSRRQAQRRLKEAKDFSEGIIDHAPVGIYTVDLRGVVETLNPAMTKIAGGEQADEKVGVNVLDLEPYRKSGLADRFSRAMKTGQPFEVRNLEYVSLHTRKRTVRHYRGIPIKATDGTVKRLLVLVEDVTELRGIEEGRELLIQQLASKNEELERFVYVVSHDLRSPLTSLRGYVECVREDVEEANRDQLEKDLRSMEKIAQNMSQMIDDLLKLSRIGREEYCAEEVDFNQLVEKVIDNVSIQLKEKGFTTKVQSGMPRLKVYARPIEEVFNNLIANAIKFTEEKPNPRVEIGFEEKETEYCFFVRDNGVGIPKASQAKLFNLFFRSGKKAGTGIGLTITKEYVQMNGGRIWVESEEGKGATFWFSLPKK